MAIGTFDLVGRARRAMLDAGFRPDFPPEVLNEIQAFKSANNGLPGSSVRDLRHLAWSSIDNDTSRDLDQVEYAEKMPDDTIRLLVGIADVDTLVAKGSATDRQAGVESTSVYTGVKTFPMLPTELSTDLTSLSEGEHRPAIVIELRIIDSGDVTCYDIYPAWLLNCAKLAYSSTGAWLEGRGPIPAAVAKRPGMDAQIQLQREASERLRQIRKQHGTLTFASVEATPVVEQGEVKDLTIRKHNVAEDIIESFMVAANVAMARFLKEKGSVSIRRVVKTPNRWDRIQAIAAQFGANLPDTPDQRALSDFLEQRKAADPVHFPDLSLSIVKLLGPGEYVAEPSSAPHDGHFGLAVDDYTHSTAPNRRFADLVTQRLLKAVIANLSAPYSEAELSQIATHCTERGDAARKVERLMRKIIAANLLGKRIGEIFDAIVTGASPKGTYVRLLKFPTEGRVTRDVQGIDVGDKVRARLISVDVDKGFIDFEKVN
jgi:exoribonuclease-2